jgi:uncharacterized membrane protein
MGTLAHYLEWDDILAFLFFILCWVGYSRFTVHKSQCAKSLLAVTNRYRGLWIREMIRRDNRTVDTIMIGNLQRSITFFANTTILIMVGLMSMLGYYEHLAGIVSNVPFAKMSTPFMFELKIFILLLIFIYAFFKYTWSLRQYNYASVFVNAVPPHTEVADQQESLLQKGTYLVSNAAQHFNNGLRAYYFALAMLPWFIHPYCFIAATALTLFVTHRREYHSRTLANLDR